MTLLFIVVSLSLSAQQTTIFTEAHRAYKQGESYMEQGIFGKAQESFRQTINLLRPLNEEQSELLKTEATFNYAKCAVLLNSPEGEKLMLAFIRDHQPDPIASQAQIELANYYFNSGDFEKAIQYYSQAPTAGMTKKERAEMRFKMGYSYFVMKKFTKAKTNFKEIASVSESDNYEAANYYLGLCYFFEGNYESAIRHFRVAEKKKRYQSQIPYYLTQIFFAQRRYDELIDYAEKRINNKGLKNYKEMTQLIGQAYFEKGNYQKALPYLEYYADNSRKMRKEEWYQLGFTQYKMGDYKKAADSFSELLNIDSKLGQSAMYYLADCELNNGHKKEARLAFSKAKGMNYDLEIQEEATFNYAKLSYEMKDPQEAINNLLKIKPYSKYYLDAQNLLGKVFLSYKDYKKALELMDQLPEKTPEIQATYQKVAMYRGMEQMQKGQLVEAKSSLQKSLQFPIDARTSAIANYWLGDIAHREEEYDSSIRYMSKFLTMAGTISGLPDESSVFTANYIQGYNYMKREQYSDASRYFQEAVDGIKRNKSFIANSEVKNTVLGDAVLRTGDCYFKRNKYNSAVKYYDEAIEKRYSGYVYAYYQKAIIEGLRGRMTDKIITLQQLSNNFPESEYADDALFQLGLTYMEIDQLSKASTPFKKIVSDYRTSSPLVNQALLQLGLISYNQGGTQTAINYYKQIFSNNPTPEEAQLALTSLEEIYVKDLGKADEYFAFLETIPGYKMDNLAKDTLEFRAAESKFENGDYARAITGYTNYIRKYPRGSQILTAYYHRGESYTVLQDYSQALLDYEKVIGFGPSRYYVKALEKGAIISYNHNQDFNKSYDLYSQLESAANTADLRFEAQLGAMRSAYRINNTQAVYNLAGKVVNNQNATSDQRNMARFYLGKISFDRNDYNNAMTALTQVVSESDNEQTAEARYLIAKIHYQQRNMAEAKQACINANKESAAYPYWAIKSVLLLSDILVEQGELYQAQAILERVLANYNEDPELVNEAKTKLNAVNAQINGSSRLDSDNSGRLELIDDNN